MNVVAVVFADFVEAPSGLPAQLLTPLRGRTILARTVDRLMQVKGLAARCLFVRPRDLTVAQQWLCDQNLAGQIELLAQDNAPRPRRRLLNAARKWNLDSWRGGLLGTTWFDEYVCPAAAAFVLDHYKCPALLCLEGHQPLFDPAIASAMIDRLETYQHECKLVFTQAPPGLAGVLLTPQALRDLLEYDIPLGLALSYRPELTQPDPINRFPCCPVPPEVAQTAARLTGDTRRSRELLEQALAELGEQVGAVELCAWLRAPGHDRAGPLPVELELELTTADPLPDTRLRPRGQRVPQRRLTDLTALEALLREFAQYDDRLVVLGGHGDPLEHPQFGEICRAIRAAGVYGLAVVSPLVKLSDQTIETLFACQVDVLEVLLDAHSPATYQAIHAVNAYEQVIANIERLEKERRSRRAPQPIIAASLTRCEQNIHELEGFYDDWLRKGNAAVLRGYSTYAGRLPPDGLLPTTPWKRTPCRRLTTRLMLLADGSVPCCSQDFEGRVCVGRWIEEKLADIWGGESLRMLRQAHETGHLEPFPMCQACGDWNRW